LQTLFLTLIASLKWEPHLLGFQLPEAVPVYQREYDLGSTPMDAGEMAGAKSHNDFPQSASTHSLIRYFVL
jgi:hypothetical protein